MTRLADHEHKAVMPIAARFEDISDLLRLEGRWRALEAEANPSFFLSWTWMGSWLEALQAAGISLPRLLTVEENGSEIALALVGGGSARRKLGSVPALWLNESGHRDGDRPFIEYNGLLCVLSDSERVGKAAMDALLAERDWKMLHLSGMAPGNALLFHGQFRRRILRDAAAAYFVDLADVRRADGGFLSLLGANTRNQIRRSLREEPDALAMEAAGDAASLEVWLDHMRRLNSGRHTNNAWDNGFFRDFVRRIALAGLADGSVELLHISAAGETVGYLLNFIWQGRAMNYQSAFAPPRTPKSKPGLMCHAAAVVRYADMGLNTYSLLAGNDRYKQNLSTHREELEWWTLERFDLRLEAEALLRRLLRR